MDYLILMDFMSNFIIFFQHQGPSAGELINRDRKGNIQCITENGLDIMKRIITGNLQ